jgi:formate hydrogenlyase transcriptional activator
MWDRHGIRSSIVAPMIVEDRVVGALACMSRAPRVDAETELRVASDIGAVAAVAVDSCLAYERLARLRDEVSDDQAALRAELATDLRDEELVGDSPAFAASREQIALVAATDATVLITGESGTGKDVIARTIHASSPRRARPMITVNCAALPAALAESELFGHEEGAFTGASHARTGRFELADQGTLFLDEVAELSLDVQAKLLRVLQERELERVGGATPIRVDVRIIAATNRDLAELVADDRFREDLYYRLRVFPIHVPPLRARKDDLPRLVAHFALRAAQRLRVPERRVTAEAMRRLTDYDWPGNVRELQNAIERAMILSRGDTLDVDAVVPRQIAAFHVDAAPPAIRQQYVDALEAAQWVIEGPAGAAARLGLHPNTLRHRLKRLGIERPR